MAQNDFPERQAEESTRDEQRQHLRPTEVGENLHRAIEEFEKDMDSMDRYTPIVFLRAKGLKMALLAPTNLRPPGN